MAILRIVQPPMLTAEVYDAVNARMGIDGEPPEGLLMHSAGVVDGTWQIVDVWESEEHARRFDSERLTPAIGGVVGSAGAGPPPPAPSATIYELHHLVRPGL
jgi:hypothetical protein